MSRILEKHPLLQELDFHLINYPTPSNISYWWNFGVLSGICLIIQIVTGIALAMHYTPHIDLAFSSVEHIMRDVNYGWLLRYIHANGASMFFIVVYIHIFRGIYYGSYLYPRQWVWACGVVILLLMMATAFMGYVLPWGQMSFWGATVITNLFSAIPMIGPDIVYWLWGGFSVDNATLNRFFSFHYALPFAIAGVSLLHLLLVHQKGSSNPAGVPLEKSDKISKITFYPYFYVKDLFGLLVFLIFFSYFVFFDPNTLGHPDNYIPANPLVTPTHIVPEWYYLPFYAILRSIPDKLSGVIAMFVSILVLFALPRLNTSLVRISTYRPLHKKIFWFLIVSCVLLGWIGGQPIEYPYYTIGQVLTVFYFSYFFIILPALGPLENFLLDYYYSPKKQKESKEKKITRNTFFKLSLLK